MKCGHASARYYGAWAKEGLCRLCIAEMPSEIRIKVLRDMYPEDRKRWQLDNILSSPWDAERESDRPRRGPSEQDVEWMVKACETGNETVLLDLLQEGGLDDESGLRGQQSDRRRQPRLDIELPVLLSVDVPDLEPKKSEPSIIRGMTRDISLRGIKLDVPGPSFSQLLAGAKAKAAIMLPVPFGLFKSIGTIKHSGRGRQGSQRRYVGVVFDKLSVEQQALLARFMTTYRASTGSSS